MRGEDRELKGLVTLGLAAREVDVHGTGEDLRRDAKLGRLLGDAGPERTGLSLPVPACGEERFGQRRRERHPGHLDRVLEGQEEPRLSPREGGQTE